MSDRARSRGRLRRPGSPLAAAVGVADPRRGTSIAVAFPTVAVVLCVGWLAAARTAPDASLLLLATLVVVPALAERVNVQLGPRSWYTASTPAIVLAGLIGGPLVGAVAGAASQVGSTRSVWRRRCAEGGLAATQGWVAGLVGMLMLAGSDGAVTMAALGLSAAVVVNTAGRLAILLARGMGPLGETLLRGLGVDVAEAAVTVPFVAIIVYTAPGSPALAGAALIGAVGTMLIAHHLRLATMEQLAAEQAIARRDQLTGAPNRRAFEEALEAEHARVMRGSLPAGLFVVDVDRFKTVNDRFGHAVGDEALIAVVERLTTGLRPSDVVARWGGEEITVLAPGLGGRHALERFARRIRALIGDEPLATSASPISLTVSVGGTLLDGSIAPLAALRFADDALYDAKRTRDASAVRLAPPRQLQLETA